MSNWYFKEKRVGKDEKARERRWEPAPRKAGLE